MPVFPWDLIVAACLICMLELVILRSNYRLLSPSTLFVGAFVLLYLFPYSGHYFVAPHPYLEELSASEFDVAFSVLRQFFYSWCAFTLFFLLRLRSRRPIPLTPVPGELKRRLVWILIMYVPILIVYLGVGVGFSPEAMLQRALHPRDFTHIKMGLGPLTHTYHAFRFLVLILACGNVVMSRYSLGAIAVLAVCVVLTVVGGSKQSFVQPLLIGVVMWQMMSWMHGGPFKKLWHMGVVSVAGTALLLFSFVVFSDEGRSFNTAVTRLYRYQKEAYYLPLVVTEWDWSIGRFKTQMTDNLWCFVPRALVPSKPAIGLWARYFRPAFEPNTVDYHTSTFGCLAEAHMYYGVIGPYIYGFAWAALCYVLYGYMIQTTSWLRAFVVSVVSAWIYLLLRTGFLGTNLVIMVLYTAVAVIAFRRMHTVQSIVGCGESASRRAKCGSDSNKYGSSRCG